MNDTEQIQALYLCLYDGMVRKDRAMLDRVLDDRFVLIHMTGQRQSKEEFIASILDGTLIYCAVRHEALPVTVRGDRGELSGRAQVTAEVFGSKRETWPLQQDLVLEKVDGSWKIVASTMSGY